MPRIQGSVQSSGCVLVTGCHILTSLQKGSLGQTAHLSKACVLSRQWHIAKASNTRGLLGSCQTPVFSCGRPPPTSIAVITLFVCVNSAPGLLLKPSILCPLPLMKRNVLRRSHYPHGTECGEISKTSWCLGLTDRQGVCEDYESHGAGFL